MSMENINLVPNLNTEVVCMQNVKLLLKKTNTYGFTLYDSCPTRVGRVEEGGSAYLAGMESGDCIISINGRNVSRSSCTSVADIIKEAGDILNLEVGRIERSESGIGTDSSQDLSDEQSVSEKLYDCISNFHKELKCGKKQLLDCLRNDVYMNDEEYCELFINIDNIFRLISNICQEMKNENLISVLSNNRVRIREEFAIYCKRVRDSMKIAGKLKRRRSVYLFLKNSGLSIFTFLQAPVRFIRDMILIYFDLLKTCYQSDRPKIVDTIKELRKVCEEVATRVERQSKVNIIEAGQYIVHSNDLLQIDENGYEQPRHVILLNDSILLCTKPNENKNNEITNDAQLRNVTKIKLAEIKEITFSRTLPEFQLNCYQYKIHLNVSSMTELQKWKSRLEKQLKRTSAISCGSETCYESDCSLCEKDDDVETIGEWI